MSEIFFFDTNKSPQSKEPSGSLTHEPKTRAKQEAEIWKQFKGGDDEAFTWIYKHYVNQLFNYGCQFSGNRELVKDVIQDLFIFLKRKRQTLSDIKFIKPYLYKSLRREIIRAINKEKRYVGCESICDKESFGISISTELRLINEQLFLEKRELLESAFTKLSGRQREAIVLYYYEELSYREIGEVMDIKLVKSVRKLVYRALDSLKRVIS